MIFDGYLALAICCTARPLLLHVFFSEGKQVAELRLREVWARGQKRRHITVACYSQIPQTCFRQTLPLALGIEATLSVCLYLQYNGHLMCFPIQLCNWAWRCHGRCPMHILTLVFRKCFLSLPLSLFHLPGFDWEYGVIQGMLKGFGQPYPCITWELLVYLENEGFSKLPSLSLLLSLYRCTLYGVVYT